jgi:hypothetical protein
VRGISLKGVAIGGAATTLTVNNPYVSGWPALKINEWLAENDGAFRDPNGDSDDWFEIYNPTSVNVDLAGWKLTDEPGGPSPFIVPSGWTIPAGGFLLIWADDETVQNPAPPIAGSALHVPFKLSNASDQIQLSAPNGQVVDAVAFGAQRSNRSQGRFPDGANVLTACTLATPARANLVTVVEPPTFGPAGISVRFTTRPGLRYTLQRSEDLLVWDNVAPSAVASGTEATLTDLAPTAGRRFYRVEVGE